MKKNNISKAETLKIAIAGSRERLYRVALAWCGDEMLADDLVQDAIAAGIAKQSQLREPNLLYAWLYSILNNKWHRYLQLRKPQGVEVDDQLASDEPEPSTHCQELELVVQVRSVIATLPMKERQVISLVDLDELSYCEVAKALDIPIGTVMSRLHRGRKRLLEKIECHAAASRPATGHLFRVK